MSNLWRRCKRIIRYYYLRVLRIHLPVKQVARGVAIGVFVGFLPIVPFHTVTALSLAFIFRASKLAAALCTFFVNPLTMIPFYAMLYSVGKIFMPGSHAVFTPDDLGIKAIIKVGLEQGWGLLHVMILGGFVLGIPFAILAYFASHALIKRYRDKRNARSTARCEDHSPASCAGCNEKSKDVNK